MNEIPKYDAVVIGAGNGGLVAASRLQKNGKKTLLIEKHIVPGGFASSFKRGRFEFEASLHEMCDCGTKENPGNVYKLFTDLGIIGDVELVTVPEAFRAIYLESGEDFTMPFGVENFIKKMVEYVPESEKSIRTFFDLAEETSKAMEYMNASRGNPETKVLMKDYPNFMRVAAYPIQTVLDAIKMPKKAQRILDTYWPYLGAPSKQMSFIHYALMTNLYIRYGAQIPKTRSHGLSLALLEGFRRNGGTVWLGDGVKTIFTTAGHISGLETESGKKVETKHVVSNASPHIVYGKLMKNKEDIPTEALKLANARQLSGRGFSLYLGLNRSPEELGLNSYSYFIYHTLDSNKEFELMHNIDNSSQVVVCLNKAIPDCSPQGTTILYFTSLFYGDCFDKAVSKTNYFELKDRLADNFISTFEKALKVKIKPYIEEIEVATPATFARYTSAPDGNIYGYHTAGLDNMMPRLMRMYQEPETPGLHFCGGHAMRSSGYNSSYQSGDLAAKFTLMDMAKEGE